MPRAKNKPIPELTPQQVERFWSKVDKTPGQGPTGKCWAWTASRFQQGYGQFQIRQSPFKANRIAYYLQTGVDPGEFEVCHDCDWEPCCRGSHLHTGSRLTNAREAVSRGLYPTGDRNGSRTHPETLHRGNDHWARRLGVPTKGERNGCAKFTTEMVLWIRRRAADGVSYGNILRELRAHGIDVTKSAVSLVVQRRSWKHI